MNIFVNIELILRNKPFLHLSWTYFYYFRNPFRVNDFPDVPDGQCINYDTEEEDMDHECNLDILPLWLTKRKDMIFSQEYITTKEILGHGQYGTVHKGIFHYGNAM